MLTIKTFYFNPYRECTYVVSEPPRNNAPTRCIIIDAGMYGDRENERLSAYINDQQLQPIALLITHTHIDHVCGMDFIKQQYPIPVHIFPSEGTLTLSEWKELSIQVLRTPGHKEDAVCYYLPTENLLFTGDTLFQESVGRTDLPGGDTTLLLHSLQQLMLLPDETTVYPGHGYSTTIAHEKENNPFL